MRYPHLEGCSKEGTRGQVPCPNSRKASWREISAGFSFYGFEKHRDLVGAMNIRYTPVIDGNSQSA